MPRGAHALYARLAAPLRAHLAHTVRRSLPARHHIYLRSPGRPSRALPRTTGLCVKQRRRSLPVTPSRITGLRAFCPGNSCRASWFCITINIAVLHVCLKHLMVWARHRGLAQPYHVPSIRATYHLPVSASAARSKHRTHHTFDTVTGPYIYSPCIPGSGGRLCGRAVVEAFGWRYRTSLNCGIQAPFMLTNHF